MTLTRDEIVDAAIRILDAEGQDGLSMRRLGAELDAGAASVYWHVPSKDALLDLVADRVIGEVLAGVGAAHTWRAWMEGFAASMRRVLRAHHGVAPVVGRRASSGPNALAGLEAVTTLLADDGFDAASALLASTTLVGWTASLVLAEASEPAEAARVADTGLRAALAGGGHPELAGLLVGGTAPTADERFDYGLGVLLDGIAAREAGRRRAAGTGAA